MNTKIKNPVILIIILTLVFAIIVVNLSDRLMIQMNSDNQFGIESGTKISKIILYETDSQQLRLEMIDNNVWMLNETTRANDFAIEQLISTLRRLTVKRPVSVEKHLVVNESLEREGVTVEIYKPSYWIRLPFKMGLIARNKLLRTFIMGEVTDEGQANYIRMSWSPNPYVVYLPGLTTSFRDQLMTEEHLWHHPVVINLAAHQIQYIEVLVTGDPEESYILKRDADTNVMVFLSQGMPVNMSLIDTQKMERYLHSFKNLHFQQLLKGEAFDRSKADMMQPPFLEMRICDIEDHCRTVSCFFRPNRYDPKTLFVEDLQKDPNRFYMQIDGGDIAITEFLIFSKVLRPLSFFKVATQDDSLNTSYK